MIDRITTRYLLVMRIIALLLMALLIVQPKQPAHAQVAGGSGFASAVPCLSAAPTYATTSMANTIYGGAQVAAPSDPALLQITSNSRSTLAPIGSMMVPGQNSPVAQGLGATYGLAYDDGSISGVRRLFAAAYVKRGVSLGQGGPGAIYEYHFGDGTWALATTVPNVGSVARTAADTVDAAMFGQVGRVGLGDLEISPDGRTLFATNLYTRQIERYELGPGGLARQAPLSIPFGLISPEPAVQADLRPFALSFYPLYSLAGSSRPILVVGIVDTAVRSPIGDEQAWIFPSAYVLAHNTGAPDGVNWGVRVSQDLHSLAMQYRELGSSFSIDPPIPGFEQVSTWNPWRLSLAGIEHTQGYVRYPQPMLTDITFSRDGQTLYLGLRDRSGDMFFSKEAPAGQLVALSQGDVLAYHFNGSSLLLQGNSVGDLFDDDNHNYPGDIPAHIENLMGAAAISLGGQGPNNFSEQLMTTSLLGANASGMRSYQATGGGITSQQVIHPYTTPGGGKATALGDVELLCSYALVGGRVWQDNDHNGIQGTAEATFPNLQLEVFHGSSASDPALATLTTDAQGRYLFAVPPNLPVNIRIATSSRISLAAQGWWMTDPNQGGNDTLDSDASNTYGYIELAGQNYGTVGGGITGVAVPMPLNRSDQRDLDIGLTRVAPTGQLGDRVWDDVDHDGVQDSGEPGHAGIGVSLLPDSGTMALIPGIYPRSTTTNSLGNYFFQNIPPGRYRLRFSPPPAPFSATLRDAGGDDARDSDVDASTGYTSPLITIGVPPNNVNTTVDFGLYGGTPDLWLIKSGPAQALLGNTLSYSLSYGNAGALQAAGTQLVDTLPAGVSYISASPAPSSVSGQTITWSLGTLAAGQVGSITLHVRAPASIGAAVSQAITNHARISTTTPNDPPGNNSSSSGGLLVRPELSISKTAPATALVGDEFSYGLSYANAGSIAAASVQLVDVLPAGLTFTRFIQNPGAACGYTAATRRVSCGWSSLAAGASGSVIVAVKADVTAAASLANTATISTATAGDSAANNSSTAITAIQFPNPGLGLSISPAPFPVGESGALTLSYRNGGTGVARSSSLSLILPARITLGALPGGCGYNSLTRVITCNLGDLAAGASGTRLLPISLPADFPADRIDITAVITTLTPERPTDAGDNSASAGASVVRPNVFVTAAGPPSIVGQGSAFWYTVDYGNQHRANPSLTRTAEDVLLQVGLPLDVTYVQADVTPTDVIGQTLIWELDDLAANAGGQIHIVVQTSVPAGETLYFSASISTTTLGDDPSDNYASVETDVVQPPTVIGQGHSDLRLAIRSELDPNSQDGDATNGVYVSEGAQIAWPAGEVLDFSARLSGISFPDEPLPFPYEYRARVVGWSIASFAVNGAQHAPQAADGRGVSGCRAGARPLIAPRLLTGCVYAYLGGRNRSAIQNPEALIEAQFADQAHIYWTQPPAPRMRGDVYLFTLDPLESAQIALQVEIEVWIVNAYPGEINEIPLPEIPIIPLPDPERQLLAQVFDVALLVPRSVVGPGSK